jgi:2-keto-4-pentenoate hydratase/2-oxohepta-3-ene-1,7-dioic acid hydratase in catechol pathway
MTKTLRPSSLALLLVAWLVACGSDSAPGTGDDPTSPPPTTDAIALARATLDGGVHLVLVLGDDGAAIDGADLGSFEGSIMERVAAQGIEAILADAADAPMVHLSYEALLPPVEVNAPSVDVVENYPDPANADDPFLFPNVARPSPATGSVPAASAELLDYQVELCVVLGQEATTSAVFATALAGFFLCEHMTDRGVQIRGADFDHPERAEGYPEASSRPGYWRTGPYLYCPRDPARYLATAELHLAVNGELRQDAAVATMRWPVNEIARQTLAIGAAARWSFDDMPIRLIAGTTLPAGLVLVTGTPAGAAFEPPSEDFLDEARRQYIFDGGYLSGLSLDEFTKQKLVEREQTSDRYLVKGDTVEASATYLGRLRITID